MAKAVKPAASPTVSPLEKEANERLKEARARKELRVLDFKECYFFAAPDRQRQISSQTQPSSQTMMDAPELNTDLAMLLTGDFTTEIVNTYMPEAQEWCERRAGEDVPKEFFEDEIKPEVQKADTKIFNAIKASNFYSELPKALNPDLAIAAAGLFIHRPSPSQPIEVLAVPLREMEINLGPNGMIDDRFIVRWARNCYVRQLLGEDIWKKVDAEKKKALEARPADRSEICWGWWRCWDRKDDEVWQHTVMLSGKLLHDAELKGDGCCPFIVMRFNPTADWPYATGPLIQGLPTLRQVDELERQKIEAVERAVSPALTYPDDSFASVEQGIEPGMAYPIRPGTEGAVKRMYDQPSVEPEIYQIEVMEKRLRKLFYVDHPEQTGDTPPTLGQWLDEMARAQRRIGTPGQSFWREGPMCIFTRFKFLLEKSGVIQPIKDKNGRMISTQPYNPAQRAAEQQEIATAAQFSQLMGAMFPEEWKLKVDGGKTMELFRSKMRVTELIAMRDQKEVEAALAQIKELVSARVRPGAAPAEGAGAPGPL